MKTTDFELQYYYRRWLVLLPVLAVNVLLAALIGNYLDGALYFAVVLILLMGSMAAGYRFTEKKACFSAKGTLVLDGSTAKISAYGKEHEVKDITELLGSTPTFFHSRCAMIVVYTPDGKVKLFSEPLAMAKEFSDSTLYPVWKALLKSFPELAPVEKFGQEADLWFKKK